VLTKHRGGVAPFDWFGMEIALSKIVHDSILQILGIREVPWRENLALKRREDDLDLIQPGGIDRQPMDSYLEGKLERSNPSSNLFGRMGGSVIEDQMEDSNVFCPETPEDHLEEVLELHEPLAGEAARHRLSGVDEQPREQVENSLPLVAGSRPNRLARASRHDSAGIGQGLDARLFIGADDDLAPTSHRSRSRVEIQCYRGLLQELRIGRLLPGMVPPWLNPFCPKPVTNRGGSNA